jgi:hypothetical protein
MDIRSQIDEDTAKKILGNRSRAIEYLRWLRPELKTTQTAAFTAVVDTWDYETSKNIIREMFRKSDKYRRGQAAYSAMTEYIKEWNELALGSLSWPFSQGDFDGFVQRVNSSKTTSGEDKDAETKKAAIKYRRIKEINTVRNDFIETLIFEKNESIVPTLNHWRGVDFFIDGISYDQKVAKSPTSQFKAHYGEHWRQVAIEHPEAVAEYLYKYQDEGRFGAKPRLLVVYLDEDVSIERIQEIVNQTDLTHPLKASFSYKHKIQGEQEYSVDCFVILLHN